MFRFKHKTKERIGIDQLPGVVCSRRFSSHEDYSEYKSTEYIEGKSLRQYLVENGGRLPFDVVLSVMRPIIDSLQIIHEAGMLHLEICPGSIIVTSDGDLKLVDLGAGRFVGADESDKTRIGLPILNPGYAPFEQYWTRGHIGTWTDVYALSATMYYMIIGIRPQDAVERIIEDKVYVINAIVSEIPGYVSKAIVRGMAIKENKRIQSVDQFKKKLRLK